MSTLKDFTEDLMVLEAQKKIEMAQKRLVEVQKAEKKPEEKKERNIPFKDSILLLCGSCPLIFPVISSVSLGKEPSIPRCPLCTFCFGKHISPETSKGKQTSSSSALLGVKINELIFAPLGSDAPQRELWRTFWEELEPLFCYATSHTFDPFPFEKGFKFNAPSELSSYVLVYRLLLLRMSSLRFPDGTPLLDPSLDVSEVDQAWLETYIRDHFTKIKKSKRALTFEKEEKSCVPSQKRSRTLITPAPPMNLTKINYGLLVPTLADSQMRQLISFLNTFGPILVGADSIGPLSWTKFPSINGFWMSTCYSCETLQFYFSKLVRSLPPSLSFLSKPDTLVFMKVLDIQSFGSLVQK